jgi:glucosamine--fructose-6-phosphate aminotransferase (isomerizing)
LRDALVIAISQSGRSPDIIAVVNAARRGGALTLALTNDDASPLAEAAELNLPLRAGAERSIAATKTFTNQLVALAMLSAALSADAQAWAELDALPARVAETVGLTDDMSRVAGSIRDLDRMVVVGRGYNYATAFEISLKLKEMAYVMADPYSPADLRHGPVAMLDDRTPLLVVAPGSVVADDSAGLLSVARERRAATLAISDLAPLLASVDVPLRLPSGTPEWLSPMIAVVPGQRLAVAIALSRGLQPDAPRGLSKVTPTE